MPHIKASAPTEMATGIAKGPSSASPTTRSGNTAVAGPEEADRGRDAVLTTRVALPGLALGGGDGRSRNGAVAAAPCGWVR